ncbi:oxidoreductase yusZ [Fusarium napiforme]|uniref:Oxidoreductase yusZ n=1 Tax=Fusarium napiforme TaxID=42672 RepID=A0A8H5NEC5_9HYPO|nr:oxidoreductase yusZ [Fusarium napiforme]
MSKYKQLVLITGANQGVGFETAKDLVLSSVKYHVIIGSRDEAKGEIAARSLQSLDDIKGTVSSIQIDVTDDNSVDAAAQTLASEWGRLDILVNNAGIVSMASPPTREAFRRVLETNLVGALSVTEAFLPLLRKSEHKPPRLIFVTSSTGSITHTSNPESPLHSAGAMEYRTSKAGLNMLMTMYNIRLKSEGFLVFGVDPGLCATNFTSDAESLKQRGAAEPAEGGERIARVVRGEKDEDFGKVIGVQGSIFGLTWFITGCSSGFGEALVRQLRSAGDNVIATGRNADTKLSYLKETGAAILDLDVSSPPEIIKSKNEEAWSIYDGIDVVVNNAGYILSGAVEELTQEDMEKSFLVNFHGSMNITRAVLPYLREKGSETLLFVGSQAGWHADPSASGYCASKFALEGAVECLSKELAIFAPVFNKIQHVEARVPDYAQFNEAVRQAEATLTENSPGDSEKAVTRMIELVQGAGFAEGKKMPFRVPLGSDSWSRVKTKCEETLEICREWEELAKSVDI